jgi:hypothetical protein
VVPHILGAVVACLVDARQPVPFVVIGVGERVVVCQPVVGARVVILVRAIGVGDRLAVAVFVVGIGFMPPAL